MQPMVANVVLLEGLLGVGIVTGGQKNITDGKAMAFDNSSQRVCQPWSRDDLLVYASVCPCLACTNAMRYMVRFCRTAPVQCETSSS